MELGLLLTQFSDRWDHTVGDARLADDLGLDSVWLADHLLTTMNVEGNIFEGWTAAAALSGITSNVRLGHLVLAASFRNPGLLAKMAATLDHAAGGRFDLGLGAGWFEAEYKAFGYRFPSPGERRRYFEEYMDALRLLFTGEAVDFDGEFIKLDQAYCRPAPLQKPAPPFVVGAGRPMMLDLVGRKADVWNCPSGLIPKLAEARERVMEAADGRRVRTTLQIPVAVGRTSEEAAAALEVGKVHMAWMGDIEAVGITGTIDEAAERVAIYAELGVDGLVGVLPGSRRRPEFIEAYVELAARFDT
jgi:alkanesulfonate monooxygenase SsuD/methylene tetrahydromethanopterin reductase-like flavin-dependent oxidoreductase (luciferase family)